MSTSGISRRTILRLGGTGLVLPFLPSLLPATARAQSAPSHKCFVMLRTEHGGILQRDMFPLDATLTESLPYAGHTVRRGPLRATVSDGEARVSAVLRAPSSELTASMVDKLWVLNGLDIPFYIGHHRGGTLGNFSASDQAPDAVKQNGIRQTIDQIMAWSPSFYGNAAGVRERAIIRGQLSYAHSDPRLRQGPVERVGSTVDGSNQNLFDRLFGDVTGGQPLISGAVMENYRRLRNGNRRLSSADRRRLDDHLERLAELDRKLNTVARCQSPVRPATSSGQYTGQPAYGRDPEAQSLSHALWNDVYTLALSCGVSRIVVAGATDTFSTFAGDWHQEIAHQAASSTPAYSTLLAAHQLFFRRVFLDLGSKLEAVDMGDGTRLLDHTLLAWAQESGNYTHDHTSAPIVAFGGAEGFFRTGQYCDYRNLAKTTGQGPAGEPRWFGLLWHQWLGTVLQSMGIPRSEWEDTSQCPGYPNFKYDDIPDWAGPQGSTGPVYPAPVWNAAGEVLPFLRV